MEYPNKGTFANSEDPSKMWENMIFRQCAIFAKTKTIFREKNNNIFGKL